MTNIKTFVQFDIPGLQELPKTPKNMGNGSSIDSSKVVYLEINGKEEKVGPLDTHI